MKRFATILLALAACSVSAAPASPAPAPFDDQMRVMGYLIMHLSGINAINGINLTRPQTVRLRDLARRAEADAPKLIDLNIPMRPDLAEVRDVYLAVRRHLLAGEEVPDALEKQVGRARGIEAEVIRLSLTAPNPNARGCARCHSAPSVPDVRETYLRSDPKAITPHRHSVVEIFIAHNAALYGLGGLSRLGKHGQQIATILDDSQTQALRSFSCCLTPPKSMSDPVRAGQAVGGQKEVDLLRFVRSVTPERWPATRTVALGMLDKLIILKSPAITPADLAAARERVSAFCDKVRALSDSDFELEKDKLAVELHRTISPEGPITGSQQQYSTAMFLLVPGSADVYDRLIKRLDAAEGKAHGPKTATH